VERVPRPEHRLHALPHGRADGLADRALNRRRPDLPAARADGRGHRAGRLHRRAPEDRHRLRQRLDGAGLPQHHQPAGDGRGRRLPVRAGRLGPERRGAHLLPRQGGRRRHAQRDGLRRLLERPRHLPRPLDRPRRDVEPARARQQSG
jgi:hypothetical protein